MADRPMPVRSRARKRPVGSQTTAFNSENPEYQSVEKTSARLRPSRSDTQPPEVAPTNMPMKVAEVMKLKTEITEAQTRLDGINFNEAAGGTDQGVFRSPTWPDEQTPGVPGPDLSQDYYVLLASTILDLKAGLYRMGVNSDDGFVVTSDNPRDVFTAQFGTAGDRGQATTLFDFVAQEDGFYPFHLIWWESTGDSECEWFIVDRTTGEQILVNDLANTNVFQAKPVKAYRPAAGGRGSGVGSHRTGPPSLGGAAA